MRIGLGLRIVVIFIYSAGLIIFKLFFLIFSLNIDTIFHRKIHFIIYYSCIYLCLSYFIWFGTKVEEEKNKKVKII